MINQNSGADLEKAHPVRISCSPLYVIQKEIGAPMFGLIFDKGCAPGSILRPLDPRLKLISFRGSLSNLPDPLRIHIFFVSALCSIDLEKNSCHVTAERPFWIEDTELKKNSEIAEISENSYH